MSDQDELRQQAAELKASGLLGKPGSLSRLFDFLLERSLSGDIPKELEIAVQVFGKAANFDVSQDAVVRVYVHKLRRRLEEFHSRSPRTQRIWIPRGEYRLVLERCAPAPATEVLSEVSMPQVPKSRPKWLGIAAALVAVFVTGAAIGALLIRDRLTGEVGDVRRSAIWSPLLADDLPITVVVGDYYLMGETDASSGVRRLVREFFINSLEDFQAQAQLSPDMMRNYVDLDLTYLPAASAFALQDVVTVLGTEKPVRILLMSDLDATVLKSSHIVYVGYISGLGMLGDRVFAASRVSPGGSYDELYDASAKVTYLSTAMTHPGGTSDFKDYGYFSSFDGPGGNRVVVIAGTRDTGVMHVAEALSRRSAVEEMAERVKQAPAFEALYEVYGVGRTNLKAKLLFAAPFNADGIWDTRP